MLGLKTITGAIKSVGKIADDLITSKEEKLKIKLESAKLKQELLYKQLDINKTEATHKNIFVAGWRPFIGWICGFALLYVSIIEPLLRFIATICFDYKGVFPVIDTTLTMQVLLGMLGLGIMRSHDKVKGTDTDKVKLK